MTKDELLDMLALETMKIYLSLPQTEQLTRKHVAFMSYDMAIQMLAEREKYLGKPE